MPQRQPRRVLMVGPDLSQRGGIAAVERALLSGWDYRRYDVRHVATYRSHHGPRLLKLVRAIPALARVGWVLMSWRPELAHIHMSQKGSLYRKGCVVLLARATGVRSVLLHLHAAEFDVHYEASGPLKRRWIRKLLRSADRLIVLGARWKDFYAGLDLDVPIDVLANPVLFPDAIAPDPVHGKVVLTLGELGKRKGTYDTLRAIPAILEAHPSAEFWFGGDGEVDEIRAIVTRQEWRDRVRFLGWVDGRAKADALATAAVFLLPSYHEGLPVAVLEAMAQGVPVVTTPVGDVPDAITDGADGFLVAPGDVAAIARRVSSLLADPALARRLGARARARAAAAYDVRAILPRLYAIYDAVTGRAAEPVPAPPG